jgi:uncharacterized protein (DUF885 family)
MRTSITRVWVGLVSGVVAMVSVSCGSAAPPPGATAAGSGDAALTTVATAVLEDLYARNPVLATDLGIHKYDDKLRDYSAAAYAAEVEAARGFKARLEAIDPATLSPGPQLDREQLLHGLDSLILQDEVIRGWEKDPDQYSGGLTNTAYTMIKREFAPSETRLKLLTTRLQAMPAVLAEARKNLKNPPKIYTEIAIEQLDGNREFFRSAVVEAFAGVKDPALKAAFKTANDAVIAALGEYKTWLQNDLLKQSNGDFAYGADTYRKRLLADEMIDTPLDQLLAVAEADLKKNQAAFAETAKLIDAKKAPLEVLAGLQADHPPASKLLATTQGELDALAAFLTEHHVITIPAAAPARVKETPPFMRATTSASMDIPGPFEKVATEAYYNMTLPDPKWPAAEQNEFMTQWYYASITNVSVHEVWPGHYLQFLYAKSFPSDVRKVFGAATNSEGWAHYAEQMVLDEGWHKDDLRYRLAQIQDALLRDVRFIVGIKLHTQGMTIAQAEEMFVKEGYQPKPVARSETKRGTSDATYGYYTMGKLMILKLRDDYRAKLGPKFTLQDFHDTFIKLGPLPLPLIRKAMLGEPGKAM